MADNMKVGARHSAKDRELLLSIRQGARSIDQAAVDLGAEDEPAQQPGKADVDLPTDAPVIWGMV